MKAKDQLEALNMCHTCYDEEIMVHVHIIFDLQLCERPTLHDVRCMHDVRTMHERCLHGGRTVCARFIYCVISIVRTTVRMMNRKKTSMLVLFRLIDFVDV